MAEFRIPGARRVLRISFARPSDIEREVAEEIEFHIAARADELVRQGASPRDARERAEAEYGDVERSRRELVTVDRRRANNDKREELLVSILDDVRYALRGLARRPALLAVTTLALAVGIAANTIMFGVVDQLLLRPPAHVEAPERVKRINFADHGTEGISISDATTYPFIAAIAANSPALEVAVLDRKKTWTLGAGPDARSVAAQLVSGNYFRLLGVRPQLGRFFAPGEDRAPQGDLVAVVSHEFWRRELAETPDLSGRQLRLQGKTFTVVGVAPRGFAGIDRDYIDVWVPIGSMANDVLGPGWHNTTDHWWARAIARLGDDASVETAAAQATAAYRPLVSQRREHFRDSTSRIVLSNLIGTRSPEGLSTESKVSLWLVGVSAIVLLIACANVANLLVARTLQRRREIAVRLALGVSRARLLQLLFTEAAVIAAIAGVVALLLAVGAGRLVQNVLLPQVAWSESVLDARILGFTFVVSVACILLAGLAPALEGVGTKVGESLKTGSGRVTSGGQRLRFALLTLQAALSIVLLIAAGLFVRSLRNVVNRDVGIDRDRVLRVTMPLSRFGFDALQIEEIFQRGADRVARLPGVTHASIARRTVPMASASASSIEVPGVEWKRGRFPSGPYEAIVDEQFFPAMGTRIVRGRNFTVAEARQPSRVAIVNEMFAAGYWPNESPLGKCMKIGDDKTCSEVIGVVGGILRFRLIEDDAMVYLTPSHPEAKDAPGALIVRVSGDPDAVARAVRGEMQALAPNMPFVTVRSFEDLVKPQVQPWRLGATMFTLFGVIALLIASVGLYSVMAFWVSQRTQEIGVRMALGAQRSDVVRMVAWQSSRAVAIGLVLGGAAAAVMSRWVATLLYETSPRDPLVYAGAALALTVAAVVASIVPARRSAAVDPAIAIRAD